MERNGLGGEVNLSQQERSEGLAGRSGKIVALCVITGGFLVVELEVASLRARGPSGKRELMPAVFEADFNRVLALHPREIVGELPAIVGQEAELPPTIKAKAVVWNVALEINFRWAGSLVEKSAHNAIRICFTRSSGPKYLGPSGARRQGISSHEPAVPGNSR